MQYADEKITSLKMEQREQQTPMSLDDGYYINGQLEKFKKAELFDKQVIVFLPESFVDMPEQISILKYPYLSRPQIIKTNLACNVNFLFNRLDNPGGLNGREVAGSFAMTLTRTNPSIKISKLTTEITQKGLEPTFFDYTSYGVDAQIYNLVCLAASGSMIIQGTFNCPEQRDSRMAYIRDFLCRKKQQLQLVGAPG